MVARAWVLQRLSAASLVLLVGAHLAVMHFVDPTMHIDFAGVSARLRSVLFIIVDWGMLFLALFHGLNGVRNIIIDYWPRWDRSVSWVLGAVGALFSVYGAMALVRFIA